MSAPTVDLRLYGIVGGSRHTDPVALVEAAIAGGATLIQYRDKHAATRKMVDVARALAAVVKPHRVPLLVNDRVDVALAAGVDGVHLGQDDMAVADARRLLGGDAIIGLTLNKAAHVDDAPVDLIDYGAIGGVFATTSKDNPDPPIGLDGLARLAARLRARQAGLPICAIAGIDESNAGDVIAAGANGVSVISSLFNHDDVAARAQLLRDVVDRALDGRKALS